MRIEARVLPDRRLELRAVQGLKLEVWRLWHESRGAPPIANEQNRWGDSHVAHIHDSERIGNVLHLCLAEIGARKSEPRPTATKLPIPDHGPGTELETVRKLLAGIRLRHWHWHWQGRSTSRRSALLANQITRERCSWRVISKRVPELGAGLELRRRIE